MRSSYLGIIGLCAALTTTTLSAMDIPWGCSWQGGEIGCNVDIVTCKDINNVTSFFIMMAPGVSAYNNASTMKALCNGNPSGSSGLTLGSDYMLVPAPLGPYFGTVLNNQAGWSVITIATPPDGHQSQLVAPQGGFYASDLQKALPTIARACTNSSGQQDQCNVDGNNMGRIAFHFTSCADPAKNCVPPYGAVVGAWDANHAGFDDQLPIFYLAWLLSQPNGNYQKIVKQ
ncbi:MAG: hypothetical protein ACOYKZ_04470 [Chlamydiia bacterium]